MRCLIRGQIGPAVVGAAAIMAALGGARTAGASITATAEVTTSQTSAPFNYTVTVHNTGDTPIGTFWFAWTLTPREYNFLPTSPTGLSQPAGWIAPITHGVTPGDKYGVEWYNASGSAIAPGGTGVFQFTSPDSPQTLMGPSWFPGFNVTHSVVYIGSPLGDSGYAFDATVTGGQICPSFSAHPASAIACPTGSAPFSVTAGGSPPLAYAWQVQTSPGVWQGLGNDPFPLPCGGGAFAYATPINSAAATIGIRPCPSATPGAPQHVQVRCVVTNGCNSATSNEATYTICPADFNCSGAVSVQDLFDFLAAWFANSASADFNHSSAVSVQDLFDFLAAWFAGCS